MIVKNNLWNMIQTDSQLFHQLFQQKSKEGALVSFVGDFVAYMFFYISEVCQAAEMENT